MIKFRTVRMKAVVNGIDVPLESVRVHRGAYGSIGNFAVIASISRSGLTLKDIATNVDSDQRTTVDVQVSDVVDAVTREPLNWQSLIKGDLDAVKWEYDNDHLELSGRDFAGRLAETRVVLKNSQYTNKTPPQIATLFAADAGMEADVSIVKGEKEIGYLGEYNLAIRTATPIAKWSLLVLMARLSGRAVMVMPGFPPKLSFKPVDVNGTPRQLLYGGYATTLNDTLVKELRGEWRPSRNSTFQVIVMSYHPKTTQTVMGQTVVFGETLQYETEKTVKEGMYKGAAAGSSRLQVGEVLKNKPAYIFYIHGLQPQECQTKSEQIAKEIAKRQFTLHGVMDGDATLQPLQPLQVGLVAEPYVKNIFFLMKRPPPADVTTRPISLDPFTQRSMFTNSVSHRISVHDGWWTEWDAWHLAAAVEALDTTGIVAEPTTPGIPVQ